MFLESCLFSVLLILVRLPDSVKLLKLTCDVYSNDIYLTPPSHFPPTTVSSYLNINVVTLNNTDDLMIDR